MPKANTLLHIARGGFLHYLASLEGAICDAVRLERKLKPVTSFHRPLAYLEFREILRPKTQAAEDILAEEVFTWPPARDSAHHLPTSLTDLADFLASFRSQGIADVTIGRPISLKARFRHILKWFQLAPALRINRFPKLGFHADDAIAVHFRGFDRAADVGATVRQVNRLVEKSGIANVVVCSDNARILGALEGLRASRVEHLDVPDANGEVNLHFGVDPNLAFETLQSCVRDLFVLARCAHFVPSVGSRTQWTRFTAVLRRFPDLRRSFFGL